MTKEFYLAVFVIMCTSTLSYLVGELHGKADENSRLMRDTVETHSCSTVSNGHKVTWQTCSINYQRSLK